MELDKYVKSGGKKPSGKRRSYRIRRFRCDVCDVYKTIYADGQKDVGMYDREEEDAKAAMRCQCEEPDPVLSGQPVKITYKCFKCGQRVDQDRF